MEAHQSSTPWMLQPRQVWRHRVQRAEKLSVRSGRLWLTREGSLEAPAEDRVLEAGQALFFREGQDWVVEALRPAVFDLRG